MHARKEKENQLTIVFTFAALNRPIVIAVVVNSAFAIEQQSVFTSFQCQRAVRAKEELIAVFWMSVSLLAEWFGAAGRCALS